MRAHAVYLLDANGNDILQLSAQANAKWLMDVDLCLVLQLNGDSKALMRNLLPGPSAFRKYREIVVAAIAIDVAMHRHH